VLATPSAGTLHYQLVINSCGSIMLLWRRSSGLLLIMPLGGLALRQAVFFTRVVGWVLSSPGKIKRFRLTIGGQLSALLAILQPASFIDAHFYQQLLPI